MESASAGKIERVIEPEAYVNHPVHRQLFTLFRKPIEKGLSIKRINEGYQRLSVGSHAQNFYKACLDVLDVSYSVSSTDDAMIPPDGPLVVVSNHPFGGLDGIILGAILSGVRSDFKILGNFLLGKLPAMRDQLISVDVFQGRHAKAANMRALREAIRWVRDGEDRQEVLKVRTARH